ncbi:uncharacterized protein DNG_07223 [Cephalotrichum gorgonifer]|uniref:VCBS repeat-containing protein n=1 Tax=Cephalotrichum gorgonifer TaxID=2041049 RepID=A0AAE8N3V0_9PEZI|nr:uncharacterized protein DNG_07223 [Cephalotrichum gorgonifer]
MQKKGLGIFGTKGARIQFADLTGDGKDDIIVVDHKGRALAWINKSSGDKYSFESINEISPGPNEDLSDARIVFEDVNGDKKSDYLVIYGKGSVKAFLNNGNIGGGSGRKWAEGIVISPGVGEPGRKIRFADLNGDGYADYLVLYDGGAVDAFLNKKNIPTKKGDGRIWGERITVATGTGAPASKIRFADITGDGREDYIVQYDGGASVGYNNTGNIPDAGRPRNWVDMGTIAAGVKDQGPVRYADLDGDGKADYLVVYGGGNINAYINICDWAADPETGSGGGGGGGGDDKGLNQFSTCEDLTTGVFPSKLWDEMDTTPYWTNWLAYDDHGDAGLVKGFAHDWGLNDIQCSINGGCEIPPECSGYEPKPGSGKARAILRSLANLHNYYRNLKDAINECGDKFSTLAPVFHEQYYKMGDDDSAKLVANNFLNSSVSVIYDLHDQLTGTGKYTSPDGKKMLVDDLFAHGEWLDTSKIPVINNENDSGNSISPQDLGKWLFNFLHASIINYAWRHSVVYIVGTKMSKKDFDDALVEKGLKYYEDGIAYFMMSYSDKDPPLGDETQFRIQKVPGWDAILTKELDANFNSVEIMSSSIKLHYQHGYNYTGNATINDAISDHSWKTWSSLTPQKAGLFNIPVCVYNIEGLSAEEFIQRITHPSATQPTTMDHICRCLQNKDKHGKKFKDNVWKLNELECHLDPELPGGGGDPPPGGEII